MEQRCSSIRTHDFEKCLKSLDKKKSKKLLEKMAELEELENNHSLIPHGKHSAESVLGKRLNVNKNMFVLELGYDRALALVVEKDKKKIFIWFWAGSHADYNNKIKAHSLNKNENAVLATHSKEISEKIDVVKKIQGCRKEDCEEKNYVKKKNYT